MCAIAIGVSIATLGAIAEPTSVVFGGRLDDVVRAVALDGARNIYIAGTTYSPDLPGTSRAFQKELHGGDAFVAKFDAAGQLQWATYLGGRDAGLSKVPVVVPEVAHAIAVDPQGNVYVAGTTTSSDFPTVNAFQSSRSASGTSSDGFLAKIDPSGSRLIYSTYLGGAGGYSTVESIAAGPAGEVWAVGESSSSQFPTTDMSRAGSVIVAKFQSSGSPLWITRTGDNALRSVTPRLAVDSFGQLNVITAAGLIQLDASGRHENFRWRADATMPRDVAAGAMGSVIVSGGASAGLAVRNAWQPEFDPAGTGFIAVLNARGVPDAISYVPGGSPAVASDGAGNIHAALTLNAVTKAPDGVRVPEHPDGPIFTTIDRGDTWTWASRGLYGAVKTLAIDAERDVLYASGEFGVFRSTDRGGSWSLWGTVDETNRGPLGASLIAIDPRDPTTMYGGNSNLYRLDQDGRVKTLLRRSTAGVGGFRVESVAVSPHDGAVWLGTGSGLEVSFDRGHTWAKRDSGFPTSQGFTVTPRRIFYDSQHPASVIVRLRTGHIMRTSDNGLTWQSVGLPANASSTEDYDFAVDPIDPEHLFLGSFLRGFFISSDGGRRWAATFSYPTSVGALAVSPVPPYQVYARYRPLSSDGTIIFSGDRGASWHAARHASQRRLPNMVVPHPTDRDRAFSVADVVGAPFVMRMDRIGMSPTYRSSFSSMFREGTIGALTASVDGETILALNGPGSSGGSDVTILRIPRN